MEENGGVELGNVQRATLRLEQLWQPSSARPTFISVFLDLCIDFNFGKCIYTLQKKKKTDRSFRISLTVNTLGVSGISA